MGYNPEAIKAANPLVDYLAGCGHELRKVGAEQKMLCPFHSEKTPSFTVYPDNHYHCFGCCESGDIFDYLERQRGLTFVEACESLGASQDPDYHIPPPSSPLRPSKPTISAKQAARGFHSIAKNYPWAEEDAWEESPHRLDHDSSHDWKVLLSLFPNDSVVWIGHRTETGSAHHARNFRRPSEWMVESEPPGSSICPSVFTEGSFSRSNDSVTARPFLVIEGDTMIGHNPVTDADKAENRRMCMAVARWLRECVGFVLVALVDTGNKSVHAWFEMPDKAILDDLEDIAPALRIDTAFFVPSQPARVPGVAHEKTGKVSRLLFANLPNLEPNK